MSTRFSLKDFGPKIPLNSVTEWLRRAGWSVKPDGKGGLLCEGPPDDDGNPITRTLPENESYGDYELRLEDLLATLTIVEERPAIQIVREMASTRMPVEEESTCVPPAVDELIAIVERTISSAVSDEQWQGIVAELSPILTSAVLAADEAGPFGGNTIEAVALFSARLVKLVPSAEETKLALWRVCSRLLLNKLALTPDDLDEFYATAVADRPDDPGNTFLWLQEQLAQPEDEEVQTDPQGP